MNPIPSLPISKVSNLNEKSSSHELKKNLSLEPSVHARTHAGWTRNSWRGRRRTVTATCVEARREERRKEEEEEEKGRERYKLSRSHVGIPVRPRRNNIQNWKERIRGIHSTNSLERRRRGREFIPITSPDGGGQSTWSQGCLLGIQERSLSGNGSMDRFRAPRTEKILGNPGTVWENQSSA